MKIPSLLFCLAALLSSARADLSGTWRIDEPRRGDVVLHTYLTLRESDGTLEGTVLINDSVDLPLRHAHFEDGEGVFDTDWGGHYRVRREGDRLHVATSYGQGGANETFAVRVPESATKPPAPLPLPPFQPIPPNGLALTPPMGWNSWNHFADRIDDRTVREIADAMVHSGLAAAGYVYVNIDDAWSGGRDAAGRIVPNSKFPDMKALAGYVHARGLKIGIYSSPGTRTCGGYVASYGHEAQDAQTFAAWGIDYLKYDWCSAARVYDFTPENLRAAYLKMGRILEHCGRPIVYSLCEYGSGDVPAWGAQVGGNLWRTTGDIQDNWHSVDTIGFNQDAHAAAAGPGHWNDPDMLEVGNGGMTPVEYRSHFSLWCLLAAPLIAGNDLRTMSADTIAILTNREVIALDQDPLGRQGRHLVTHDQTDVLAKPLHDGGVALGFFNRADSERTATFTWPELGFARQPKTLRDLWAHRDLTPAEDGCSFTIPAHGVVLLRAR